MPALSEKAYHTLHELLNQMTKVAYERGYADAKASKPCAPDVVKVSMANTRRIKLQ